MKKLGKKNYEVNETVEAYEDCAGRATCWCSDGFTGGYQSEHYSGNNEVYSMLFSEVFIH